MREFFLKRYALFICLLLIINECKGRRLDDKLEENSLVKKNHEFDNFQQGENQKVKDHSPDVGNDIKGKDHALEITSQSSEKSKRIVGAVILVTTGLSAAIDIYKAVAGCEHYHGDEIERNAKLAKKLRQDFLTERQQINLDWAEINGRNTYLSTLHTNMQVVKKHISRLDVLKTKIIKLLDSDILNKFDDIKANVTNMLMQANETNFADPDVFLKELYTASSLATMLAIKLVPLAAWVGFSGIPSMINKVATKYASKAQESIIVRASIRINEWGIAKFNKLATKWNTFVDKVPTNNWIKSKLNVQLKGVAKDAQKATLKSKIIKGIGAAAAIAFMTAFEVTGFLKFKENCEQRYKESKTMVADLQESLKNISYARGNMTEMKTGVKEAYKKAFSYFSTGKFATLVKDAIDTATHAEKQTDLLKRSIVDMQYFLKTINTTWNNNGYIDYSLAEKTVKRLIEGFEKINYKLTCVSIKLRIIKNVNDKCSSGTGTMKSLWNESRIEEGRDLKDCIENQQYLTKQGVIDVITKSMASLGKSTKCIRNNKNKFQLTCEKWLDDIPNNKIMEEVIGTDLSDIAYFINKCPLGSVNDLLAGQICRLKAQKTQSISTVYAKYFKYKPEEILATWKACELGDAQKKGICTSKANGYKMDVIKKDYPNFDISYLKNIFDNCVTPLSPIAKMSICNFYRFVKDLNNGIYTNYKNVYGEKQVIDHVNNVCKKQGR